MLENFILSLNIIFPMILLVVLGFYLKRIDFINRGFLISANKLIFYAGIPSLLFINIYQSDIVEIFDLEFILFISIINIIYFFVAWVITYFLLRKKAYNIIGAFVQGTFRGNITILALPILLNILGDYAAKGALVVAVLIPMYNILSVIMLSIHSNKNVSVKAMIIGMAKNPPLLGTLFGILVSLSGIRTPMFARSTLSMLSQITTPIALICLGAGMTFEGFSNRFKYALYSSFFKTIIMPAIIGVLAYIWGFYGIDMVIFVIMSGVPTSITSYVMIVELGGDEYVASTNIVLTTVMSGVTMTFWIFILMTLGFL